MSWVFLGGYSNILLTTFGEGTSLDDFLGVERLVLPYWPNYSFVVQSLLHQDC